MPKITAISYEDPKVRNEARAAAKEISSIAADSSISPDERIRSIGSIGAKPDEDKEKGYVYTLKSLLLEPELSDDAFTAGCRLLSKTSFRGASSLIELGLNETVPEKRRVEAIRFVKGTRGMSTAIGCLWEELRGFLSSEDSSRTIVIELAGLLGSIGEGRFEKLIASISTNKLDDHALWIEILRGFSAGNNFPPPSIEKGYPPSQSTKFSRDCMRCLKNGHSFPGHLAFQSHVESLQDEDLSLLVSVIGDRKLSLGETPLIVLLNEGKRPMEIMAEAAVSLAVLGSERAVLPLRALFNSEQLDERTKFKLGASLWALGEEEPRLYLSNVFRLKSRILEAGVTSSLVTSLILRNKSDTSVRLALKFYRDSVNNSDDLQNLLDNFDLCLFCSIGSQTAKSEESGGDLSNKLTNSLLGFVFNLIDDRRVSDWVRTTAIQRFKYISFPGVVEKLINEARSEENSVEFRANCIKALGPYFDNEEVSICFGEFLRSEDPTLRRAALAALDQNLSPDGLMLLKEEVSSFGLKNCNDSFLTMSLPDSNKILYDSLFDPRQFLYAAKCLEKKFYSEAKLREFIESLPRESIGHKERYRRALSMCPDLGILAPFRYPPHFLVELVRNRMSSADGDPRRKLLYLAAQSDHNGALTEFSSIIHQISERFRYRVVLFELVGSRQYGTVLDDASANYPKAFDAVVVAGHGSPDSITLGSGSRTQTMKAKVGDANLDLKNIHSLKGKGSAVLKDAGVVYLHSCGTARDISGTNMHVLHRAIFPNAREAGVVGAKTPISADEIYFAFSSNFELETVSGRSLLGA